MMPNTQRMDVGSVDYRASPCYELEITKNNELCCKEAIDIHFVVRKPYFPEKRIPGQKGLLVTVAK